jgi:hypothetical protein
MELLRGGGWRRIGEAGSGCDGVGHAELVRYGAWWCWLLMEAMCGTRRNKGSLFILQLKRQSWAKA